MKYLLLFSLGWLVLLLIVGTPFPVKKPNVDHHWGSTQPILPMSFKHVDHMDDQCVACHHNYVDDTGDSECLLCHVNDERVAPLLREQFHQFCMGCHLERQQQDKDHGPVRRCISCHLFDRVP